MRKFILGAALASTALATPALARDDSWYIELDGGVTLVDDFNLAGPSFNRNTVDVAKIDSKAGYDIATVIGYDFGMFRLEGEANYRRAPVSTVTTVFGSSTVPAILNPAGKVSARGLLLNGLIDLGDDDGMQVYAGGGVGYGRVNLQAQGNIVPNRVFSMHDSDDGFAWQLLAGVRVPLTGNWDAGLKYRFYNQSNVSVPLTITDRSTTTPVPTTGIVDTRWRSHSVMATIGYNFGGPRPVPPQVVTVDIPPPPPPAPPAPPPVVEAPVCNKGPYIVFFDWDKSDITPEAASILDSAVAAYGNCANVPIMLAGYADRSGKPSYNQGLSERRNASVTSYLTSHGIPGSAITSQGFGETNNRVPTADGVRELQNRRVEITYGPGSGM